MNYEELELIQQIKSYIIKNGGIYSSWYAGIAKDPRSRLFNDHAVDEKSDAWIFRIASSSDLARNVEQHFIQKLGTDGDTGGGDDYTKAIYAYRKSFRTNP